MWSLRHMNIIIAALIKIIKSQRIYIYIYVEDIENEILPSIKDCV
jgi:hypothetical protein